MPHSIVEKLAREWDPHVLHGKDDGTLRKWLRKQKRDDIGVYISTRENTLDTEYPGLKEILQQEHNRNWVNEIWAAIRRKRPLAALIVIVSILLSVAGFHEKLCSRTNDRFLFCTSEVPHWSELPLDEYLKKH